MATSEIGLPFGAFVGAFNASTPVGSYPEGISFSQGNSNDGVSNYGVVLTIRIGNSRAAQIALPRHNALAKISIRGASTGNWGAWYTYTADASE